MLFKFFGFSLCLLTGVTALPQSEPVARIQLQEAYDLLEARYPLLRNAELIDQLTQTQLYQLDAGRLPTIAMKADGRLQSENVTLESDNQMLPLNISRPLVTVQTYLDASYRILDGGRTTARKNLLNAQSQVQRQQLEVDRFQLRERLNQLFLAVTALRAQTNLLAITLSNLRERKAQVSAGVAEGALLPTELTQLEVKEQELLAQAEALNQQQRGLLDQLEYLLDIAIADDVILTYPNPPADTGTSPIQRPEQALFQARRAAILAQDELADAEKKPQLNVFAQAGYGYPNPLNFLDDGAAPYGILGVGFSWQLVDWDKTRLQQQIHQLQAAQVQRTQETFEFNLNQRAVHYRSELRRVRAQIAREEEIARLQARILEQMAVQLEEGVITTTDYVSQLNNELRARQRIELYNTQLRRLQIEFWHERGGF